MAKFLNCIKQTTSMGFFDRLHNAWKIFKISFEFIGRDKSLMIVPVLMLLSGILFCILAVILYPFVAIMPESYFYVSILLFVLLAQIWSTFLAAIQSWMVHEVAQGKDTTIASGFKRALHNFKDIIAFAVVFVIISILISILRKRGGRMGRFAAGWLDMLAGIVGKLVLPAMIITERNFGQAVGQLKHSVKAIPEIATFEIGIRPLTTLAIFLGVLAGLLFYVSFGLIFTIIYGITFVVAIILLTLFINNTYYTLLYLTLIEKKHVKGLHLR
jgi:hypothetical protein